MQGSMAEMVGAFVPRVGLSNIVCSEVPQDEVCFRICDCDCRATSTSTSLVMGTLKMTSSGVEGETDLPFLPEGAGNPFGQGTRGTRGLSPVRAGTRPDRVLCREFTGSFFGLVSDLQERLGRTSQCVEDQSQPKNTTGTRNTLTNNSPKRTARSHHRAY